MRVSGLVRPNREARPIHVLQSLRCELSSMNSPSFPLKKVISGGQTGVDRGALTAALCLNFDCGGWCPPGRVAEDGVIPDAYPMSEMVSGHYPERTLRNVIDSDATVIFHFGPLEGGTQKTQRLCVPHAKPHLLIDGASTDHDAATDFVRNFVMKHSDGVLNVAGPRHTPSI